MCCLQIGIPTDLILHQLKQVACMQHLLRLRLENLLTERRSASNPAERGVKPGQTLTFHHRGTTHGYTLLHSLPATRPPVFGAAERSSKTCRAAQLSSRCHLTVTRLSFNCHATVTKQLDEGQSSGNDSSGSLTTSTITISASHQAVPPLSLTTAARVPLQRDRDPEFSVTA